MGGSLDTATLVTATGLRATRTVATVDDIEPELVGFVRTAVRWLDPRFPQKGLLRLYRMTPIDGPYEGAIRIIAVGVANEARLELRWNFVASDTEVRGTSALLIVEGARETDCIADFVNWFDGN